MKDFLLPIDVSRLQNGRMRLVPIDEDLTNYAQKIVNDTKDSHELYKWLPYGPFTKSDQYIEWYDGRIGASKAEVLFAILLRPCTIRKKRKGGESSSLAKEAEYDEFQVKEDTFAGIIGLLDALPTHSSVEIGHVMILSQFQRTFVTTNAISLLLNHLLEPLPADLNMRRVMWQANSENKPSIAAAERMGFHFEGIARWQRVLPAVKGGVEETAMPRKDYDGRELGPGRHSAMLSLCWDDWISGGGKEKVQELMNR